MPRFKTSNAEGDPVERYQWPAEYVMAGDGIGGALRNWRKAAIRDREEYLALQKMHGQEDRDLARFFKECANRSMRVIRAITLAIPWFDTPDAGQVEIRPLLWPLDLEKEMDEVAGRIALAYG